MRFLLPFLLFALIDAPAQAAGKFTDREDVAAFLRQMHERHGFKTRELHRWFADVKPMPAVIKAVTPPAEPGLKSWQAYRQRFIEPKRIRRGLAFWQQHGATLARAEARTGVPAAVIVAIIGIETIYGHHLGKHPTLATLANLAFDYPPRADLFRQELEELLLLARTQKRDPRRYTGSFAGALGLPQFLPSSVRRWGRDGDGDGRVDLADSPSDAIASVANFLKEHGWEAGNPISWPAALAPDIPAPADGIAQPSRTPDQWSAMGIKSDNAPALPAALVDLPTPQQATEYRLGFRNFYVITRYNRSFFYAAAVQDLADTLSAERQ